MSCTVASLIPFAVKEPTKPGLHPGEYPLGPSDGIKPVLLTVKDAVRGQYNENFKLIDFPVAASVVANSIVADYVLGQQLTSFEACPALFWVEGTYTLEEFEKRFAKEIRQAQDKQFAWFQVLVKAGDDQWQQFHQHKFITDLQRAAARFLNYKREWLDDSTDRTVKCGACMTLVSQSAAICFACHAILNEEKFKTFKFVGAPAPTPVSVQPVK